MKDTKTGKKQAVESAEKPSCGRRRISEKRSVVGPDRLCTKIATTIEVRELTRGLFPRRRTMVFEARIHALRRASGVSALAALFVYLGVSWIFATPCSGIPRPLAVTPGWLAGSLITLSVASGGRVVHANLLREPRAQRTTSRERSGSPWVITIYVVSAALLMRILPVRNNCCKARQLS